MRGARKLRPSRVAAACVAVLATGETVESELLGYEFCEQATLTSASAGASY